MYKDYEVTGFLQLSQQIENNNEVIICASIISRKNHQILVQINNLQDYSYTLEKPTHIALFSRLAPIRHLFDNIHDEALQHMNGSLKTPISPQ